MTVPLVYACSGGSGAGQVANGVAVCLDRLELAEMSSIVAVGGDSHRHLEVVRSGRPIIAIDGCQHDCVLHVLARHDITPILHVRLDRRGTDRHYHESHEEAVIERELAYVADVIQRLEWGEGPDSVSELVRHEVTGAAEGL